MSATGLCPKAMAVRLPVRAPMGLAEIRASDAPTPTLGVPRLCWRKIAYASPSLSSHACLQSPECSNRNHVAEQPRYDRAFH